MSGEPLKVVQWNVFEDGLTDAPASVGFQSDFDLSFTSLLTKLCYNAEKEAFWAFSKTRDFTQLPRVSCLNSTRSFFNFIDVLYCVIYHSIGGEARFGSSSPGDPPDLAMTFRSLFLYSALSDLSKSPSTSNQWTTPQFEQELAKISAPPDVATRIRSLRDQIFDGTRGCVTWERSMVDGVIWKRKNNVWENKWMADLAVFLSPPAAAEPCLITALSRFMRTRCMSDPPEDGSRGKKQKEDGSMNSLIDIVLDEHGKVQRLQTLTFQAAVHWLLLQLCEHAMSNDESAHAVCVFAKIEEAPATAEGRVMVILPIVLQEIDRWFSEAVLASRCLKMHRVIEQCAPDILTVVEYDEQWRKQKLPSSKCYAMQAGKGTAAIMFDSEKFERIETVESMDVSAVVPPVACRLDALADGREYEIAPKSSCLVLLQRKTDSLLFLVAAVHMESAPPSDTVKVNVRACQMRALLTHLSEISKLLNKTGHKHVLIVGGDFNALAEEFLHGTSDAFWQSPGVIAVRPPLSRPSPGAFLMSPPTPPLARMDEDGSLYLLCEGVDGGELRAVSRCAEVSCTRAGCSMVIDFIFVGTGGGGAMDMKTAPLVLASLEESGKAADDAYGIYNAVMRWGSDHLPVGAEIAV